jgi:hypothetical protein
MTRLQILELPEGAGDERPPFVLVVDQCEPLRIVMGPDNAPPLDPWQEAARQIGALYAIVTHETIEIPANEVSIGPDGYPVRLRVEADLTSFDEQVDEAVARAADKMRQGAVR